MSNQTYTEGERAGMKEGYVKTMGVIAVMSFYVTITACVVYLVKK